MKRIFLILCILCVPVFLFGQWVDTEGSTWAATATRVEKEIKDIQNDVLDRGIDSWQVTITSGLESVFVLISTNTVAELAEIVKHYVLTSSNTAATLTEMIKHYVLTSTTGDTTVTRLDSILNQLKSSVTVSNILYSGKVSTGTSGKIFTSGNISPDDEVKNISFYTEGGNAQITCTFRSGIIYIREGIPFGMEVPVLVDNPTFQCVLDAGTTLYYSSDEVD